MFKKPAQVFCFLSVLCWMTSVWGDFLPKPPVVQAKSYLLIDFSSNQVLAEKDKHLRTEPASLTKMMTVYVLDQAIQKGHLKLTDRVVISERAWRMEGSRMFVDLNSQVPIADLLKGVIIQSGNDASVALAEHLAGSEDGFVELMNAEAKRLGMTETHFANATGLPDPQHYSSAADLAILARALIQDFPLTYKLYSEKSFNYKNILQHNRNRLLWRAPEVDGIKTGHTESAGYCLVSSGQKVGQRLIAVLLGADSDDARTTESNKLLTYGFQFFETRQLYHRNQILQTTPIWMGQSTVLEVGVREPLYVTLPKGISTERLDVQLHVPASVRAPVLAGAPIGHVAVLLDQKSLLTHPVVALNNVPEGHWLRRGWHTVWLSVKDLWQRLAS